MIRDCDGHPIYPLNSDNAFDGEKPIIIGNHVSIGSEATLMKGMRISDGCVIGWGSLVTHDFSLDSSTVIAGSQAKMIKENIRWEH